MTGSQNPDYRNLTDEELIARFQRDDLDAYNEIVKRYRNRIINFIFKFTNNREDAEDLTQEAFIKLFLSKHLYKEMAKFSTWFHTVAINIAKTYKRSKHGVSKVFIDESAREGNRNYELKSNTPLPDEIINSTDENILIQEILNSMDMIYKEVLLLRDLQNLEYEEIAIITGLPLGTVKTRVMRGRQIIKETLEKTYKEKQTGY